MLDDISFWYGVAGLVGLFLMVMAYLAGHLFDAEFDKYMDDYERQQAREKYGLGE